MAHRAIGEGDAGADGDARSRIGAAHDRLHVVADGVEPLDRLIVAVKHLGVLIDDWDATLARPEVKPHLVLQGHAGNIRIAFCDGFAMGGTALEFIEASDEIRGKFSRLKSFCHDWDGRDPIRGKIGSAHAG